MSLTRKVAFNASALAAGRAAAAAIGVVSVGISTRYLGLGDYGALAAALGLASVVGLLTDFGMGTIGAREIAKRPAETQQIVRALVTAAFALSLVATGVGVAAAFAIYGGEEDELVRRGVLLLLITVPFSAPYGAASAYFISKQQPWMGMIGSVLGSMATVVLLVAASTLDWGFTGVALAYVSTGVVQWVVMMALSRGKIALWPSRDLALARQLLRWALPIGATVAVASIYWRIDIVLLSVLTSDEEVGLYGLAYRVVDALVVLPSFVTITLLPELGRLADQRERFDEIVRKGFRAMQVAAIAVFVPFVVLAPQITGAIGGLGFQEASPVLRLLMIGVGLNALSMVFAQAIVGLNRQGRLFFLALVMLVANVALNLALIPSMEAEGAALAFSLTEVVHLAGIVYIYRRIATPPRPWKPAAVLVAGCAMAGATAAGTLLPVSGEVGWALEALVGGSLGLSVYVAALYALRAMPVEIDQNLLRPLGVRLGLVRRVAA